MMITVVGSRQVTEVHIAPVLFICLQKSYLISAEMFIYFFSDSFPLCRSNFLPCYFTSLQELLSKFLTLQVCKETISSVFEKMFISLSLLEVISLDTEVYFVFSTSFFQH